MALRVRAFLNAISSQGRLLEGLPGHAAEVGPDELDRPFHQGGSTTSVGRIVFGIEERRRLGQVGSGFVSQRLFLLGLSPKVLPNLVAGDGPQPATETAAALVVVLKVIESHQHGLEDILQHVGSVVVLQPSATGPMVDQRRVNLAQPLLSLRLVVADAINQRNRSGIGMAGIGRLAYGHRVGAPVAARR